MSLRKLWQSLLSLFVAEEPPPLPWMRSPERFRAILRNESCRADRRESGLSLVIFNVERSTGANDPLIDLAHVLEGRIRATDELGWLGRGRLGVLLPETSEESAHEFIGAVRALQQTEAGSPVPAFEIALYAYPSKLPSDTPQSTDQAAGQTIDGLIALTK